MDPSSRMQQAVEGVIGELERSSLRPLQREGFVCSAHCCENASFSHQQVQQCVQQCSVKAQQAESVLSQELKGFQERLQRCAMQCRDRVQDRVPADGRQMAPHEMAVLQAEVETCSNKCVDEQIALLPRLKKRVESGISAMR